jgi:hypothetical protein
MKRFIIILSVFLSFFLTGYQGQAQNGISLNVQIAPPDLPEYDQPLCPGEGYLWSPGYWAYGDEGYFWVPGIWVYPPVVGYLWTPSYWAYSSGYYYYHAGYWGEHVGYYGGINYGYGYNGDGFHGGRWEGRSFHYNTAVMNVNRNVIHNTYHERYENKHDNRSSYNGAGGVDTRPIDPQRHVVSDHHVSPTPAQTEHHFAAGRSQNKSVNHSVGSPAQQQSRPVRSMPDTKIKNQAPAYRHDEKPSLRATPNHQNKPARHEANPKTNQPRHDRH